MATRMELNGVYMLSSISVDAAGIARRKEHVSCERAVALVGIL
jgi:hypothetical protein